jgi:Tfp pilus assembly protein PilF
LTEADADLKQVLHFRPDSAEAHFAMAGVFRAEALPKLEKEELNTALRLKPDLLGARLALARNLLRANQAKLALEILDKAPEAQQNVAGLVIERNWALLAAGDTKELERRLNLYLKPGEFPSWCSKRPF